MKTESVLVTVMKLLSTFDAGDIIARATTCMGRLSVQGYQRGAIPRFAPTYCGSAESVVYIVAKYDEAGEEDPLYQPLEDTVLSEEYSTEMKVLRVNMLRQKGGG